MQHVGLDLTLSQVILADVRKCSAGFDFEFAKNVQPILGNI
jgi:hypothetical protein